MMNRTQDQLLALSRYPFLKSPILPSFVPIDRPVILENVCKQLFGQDVIEEAWNVRRWSELLTWVGFESIVKHRGLTYTDVLPKYHISTSVSSDIRYIPTFTENNDHLFFAGSFSVDAATTGVTLSLSNGRVFSLPYQHEIELPLELGRLLIDKPGKFAVDYVFAGKNLDTETFDVLSATSEVKRYWTSRQQNNPYYDIWISTPSRLRRLGALAVDLCIYHDTLRHG